MKLIIDNRDGRGPLDYSDELYAEGLPRIARRLNRTSEMTFSLAASDDTVRVPACGARVILERSDGSRWFTGYVAEIPQMKWLGYGQSGNACAYAVKAVDDSWLLDRNAVAGRPPFALRTAGEALRTITSDVVPGLLDVSGVQDVGAVHQYATSARKPWSEHVQELAATVRASYRLHDGELRFAAVGAEKFEIREDDPRFDPRGLRVDGPDLLRNDVTVVGEKEPRAYVRDYFLGDGATLAFHLSSQPFGEGSRTVFQEDYLGAEPSPTLWHTVDPNRAITVADGEMRLNGGASVQYTERLELAGGLRMQHGDVVFSAASSGVIGGIYDGGLGEPNCLAGFRISPSGSNCAVRAVVSGTANGPVITTQAGHVYSFVTQVIANEAQRQRGSYVSSKGSRGGETVGATVRFVLSVHDVDPNSPNTIAAARTVLYDGVIANTPGFATYALVDATDLHCRFSFTRLQRVAAAEVRSMAPGQSFRSRVSGGLTEGGECYVTSAGSLHFYAPYPPQANEQIIVAYRSSGQSMARVQDPSSIAATANGADEGRRSLVTGLSLPGAGTSVDCENAALALLDDSTGQAWKGEYRVLSEFLPVGDVWPGMGVHVAAPSWSADFDAVVREVEVRAIAADRELYEWRLRFANDAAEPIGLELASATLQRPVEMVSTAEQPSSSVYLPAVTGAQITNVIATEVTVDMGMDPPSGGGFEVRWSDGGWGAASSGNLAGRFTTRSFTLPRLARVQDYYFRQYDGSSPRKYGRYSALLHLDYPL